MAAQPRVESGTLAARLDNHGLLRSPIRWPCTHSEHLGEVAFNAVAHAAIACGFVEPVDENEGMA